LLSPADHVLDIGLDVDAGLILEFLLAVFLTRQRPLHPLSERRSHHLAHIGIRHHGDVARHVLQLVRAAAGKRSGREPDVVGSEPAANANDHHRKRKNNECSGSGSHGPSESKTDRADAQFPRLLIEHIFAPLDGAR
jgi:hypothetical protein